MVKRNFEKLNYIQLEDHFINRSSWLRASILGANDGILSTASIIIGVAAASQDRNNIIVAGVAGLVAGALSMAAGEYVSVSSQSDIEHADIQREIEELKNNPSGELIELAEIYQKRGLSPRLAMEVATELTAHDALGTHARDELGINEMTQAKPLEAALASGASFVFGGALPVIVAVFGAIKPMIYLQYGFSIGFLILLGAIAAKTGGSDIWKAISRITFWGTVAMGITGLIGHLFQVSI